ncbi:MAG: carboxypeptidase-like regulatory domain-containing protein [Tannerellaceae bacterium]|nr:carboxypeptidase-like regulatory domain-containing protein [Tannerellaceae bacterium]
MKLQTMNYLTVYKTIIYTLLILLFSPYVQGQATTKDWQFSPGRTFVFELNPEQVEQLFRYTNEKDLLVKLMTTPRPIASFTDQWEEQPEKGHFVYANLYKNEVTLHYTPVIPFQIFLIQEYGRLSIQVVDKNNKLRKDALARIKNYQQVDVDKDYNADYYDTPLKYDPVTHTYTVEETSQARDRILTVELDGFTAYLDLSKSFPYRTNSSGRWHNRDAGPSFYSYMITDKNKYKPGETVRFKSYALNSRKNPLFQELEVWLYKGYGDTKLLQKVKPNHPGNYASGFLLHDSLEIHLDKNYALHLKDRRGQIVASTSFRYEDYELYDTDLEIKLHNTNHFHPENNILEIHAKDANGLTLPDARVEVRILSEGWKKVFEDIYILPDTILQENLLLDNTGPTQLVIPAYLFGKSNLSYTVEVTVRTLDHQPLKKNFTVSYYYDYTQLVHTLEGNAVRFDLLEKGKSTEQKAWLYYDGEKEGREITLPHKEPFDQTRNLYTVRIPERNLSQVTDLYRIAGDIPLQGGFADGQFTVQADNPLDLEFSWYLYAGPTLLKKGFGKTLNETIKRAEMNTMYYVELFYRIGDREKTTYRTFSPAEKHLEIQTNLPDRVYPGQEIEATIEVKDIYGKPAAYVDLTAMAYNKLLNCHLPDLPYYGPSVTGRKEKVSYELYKSTATAIIPLAYDYWNIHARLDTIDFYRFIYPREKMFIHTEDTPDGVTQFAPYVMHEGKSIQIYAIEQNEEPIWFSWTHHIQGYSFPADAYRAHTISLRLHDRIITLKGIRFAPGKKTVLSLERDYLPEWDGIEVVKIPYSGFTEKEKARYSARTSEIPVRYTDHFTWLKQGRKIYPVHYRSNSYNPTSVLVGPVPEGETSYMDGITYRHTGRYRYEYDGNVVYKYATDPQIPGQLTFRKEDKLENLHDYHITVDSIHRHVARITAEQKLWQPESFHIYRPNLILSMTKLKQQEINSPITGMIFHNQIADTAIVHPKEFTRSTPLNTAIPAGMYDIYLLYKNGEYMKAGNIPVQSSCCIILNMHDKDIQPVNEQSLQWTVEMDKMLAKANIQESISNSGNHREYYYQSYTKGKKIEGTILDTTGEPLIGATITVVGSDRGVLSDLDGNFMLSLEGIPLQDTYRLRFSFIGMKTVETYALPDSFIEIEMEDDVQAIEEVVVIGYGTTRKVSITGAMMSGGWESEESRMPEAAPTETVENPDNDPADRQAEERLYQELLTLSGIRKNFSDVGFWEPALYTDKKGKASFKVTIPDNITQWSTLIYAMDWKLQTGTLRQAIKSYKPLMGELKTPQFLVAGDSAWAAATIRNYTQDKQITGRYQYTVDGDTIQERPVTFEVLWQQRMPVNPTLPDSLTTTFLFTRNDGYQDGEERKIPVIPAGTVIANGELRILKNSEKIEIETLPGEGTHVNISGKPLDIYLDVTHYLMGYEYACNEQLASKLAGLLCYKMYVEQYKGETFRYDKQVNEIIRRLTGNQNKEQLWSWWGNDNNSSFWMSAHILRTLKMAADAGYEVNVNLKWARNDYMQIRTVRNWGTNLNDIELLHTLSACGIQQDYEKAVTYFEETIQEKEKEYTIQNGRKVPNNRSYLKEKLLLWEIRRQQGLPFDTDNLTPYLHTSSLGYTYCDDYKTLDWRSNTLASTLIAYRLIRNDSIMSAMKEAMQMYILSTKGNYWNTYQAATVLSTILPDLLQENATEQTPSRIALQGKENREITALQYKTILRDGEKLTIEKKDGLPVFYSAWIYKRKTEGYTTDAFEINTHFENHPKELQAGTPVKLIVNVAVKQSNSEYIMVEVPIPAGCSYGTKKQHNYNEVHREYFKEKTVIFCRKLDKGNYRFEIELLPRFTGNYHLNPAKVELMYQPVINAMNDMRKVKIADFE